MYDIKISKSNSIFRAPFKDIKLGIEFYDEAKKITLKNIKKINENRKNKIPKYTVAIFKDNVIVERFEI